MTKKIIPLNTLLGIPEKAKEVEPVNEGYDVDIQKMDMTREQKAEQKMARIVMMTNAVGKVCQKKRQRPKMKPKAPRNYTRNTTFVNYGNAIGMTDDEYRNWKKTGEVPARLLNKEGN